MAVTSDTKLVGISQKNDGPVENKNIGVKNIWQKLALAGASGWLGR